MKKVAIDNFKYYELTYAMMNCGINSQVFDVATKMDFNLPYLFYEKLIINRSEATKEQLSKNLLGIYGNLIAQNYFSGLGYYVVNEYPIYDENGNATTKADLYFKDRNGVNNYCEVKTAPQIIDNASNYIDDEDNVNLNIDKVAEMIKYKHIGKKLLKQVQKLANCGGKVNVVVFNGCYIDDVILSELEKCGVNIITMACNIKDLENYVDKLVDDVDKRINKENTYKMLKTSKLNNA